MSVEKRRPSVADLKSDPQTANKGSVRGRAAGRA